MPIATPEIYAQMLDRAKQQGFAYPAINVTSSQTLNAALKGFADAESDGIIQVSTGGAEYLSGQGVKDMAPARPPWPSSRTWSRPSTRSTSPCTPTTAPRTSWTASCARWSRSRPSGSGAGRGAAVPLPHVRRLRGAAGREHRRSPGTARRSAPRPRIILEVEIGVVGGEEDGDAGEMQREAVHHPRGRPGGGRGARARRAGPLPAGRHLRQRARRLQARARGAHARRSSRTARTPSAPSTARRSRSTWSSTAAPARAWRRSARPSTTAWSR